MPRSRHKLFSKRPDCWFVVGVALTMVQGVMPRLLSCVDGCSEKYGWKSGQCRPVELLSIFKSVCLVVRPLQ